MQAESANTDRRRHKGMEIAATSKITKQGHAWIVPSQSLNGRYSVTFDDDGFRCSCPDFESRQKKCKHVFAVEFTMRRERNKDGSTTVTASVRLTYPQDWPAYNKAQSVEKEEFCNLLRELCGTVEDRPQGRGRPRIPLEEALFAAGFKVYSGLSGRRFMTDMRDAAERGFVSKAPCYNSIFNVIESEEVTPVIKALIEASSLPLRAVEPELALERDFAIDATGFGLQRFYRHYSARYGHEEVHQDYLKTHIAVGVKTHIVTAVEVTHRDAHDSTQFATLVQATAKNFRIAEVSADKAYNSRDALALVKGVGAEPYIPFRANQKPNPKQPAPTWDRLFHYYNYNRDAFLAHYHKRSNVESVFSMIKRKFGDTIRSKTPTAQVNEMLLKVLAHNVVCLVHSIHELGIEVTFGERAA